MSAPRYICVLDIGRTNVKFAVVDLSDRSEIATSVVPNTILTDGPYPHTNTGAIWDFFSGRLTEYAARHPVDGIAVSAHGSAVALIGDDDLVLPILDYEYEGPDELTAEYDAVRPDFTDTLSPRLPKGFNLGAQLFWLQRRFPDPFGNARAILTYAQYWVWRMTGVIANEITSVGCHTDLWDQKRWQWSVLAERQGWTGKLAPLHSATTPAGYLRDDLAKAWGLARPVVVAGGLHDSNASLVPHLLERRPPFTVQSTGTWAISFGVGASPDALDERRDTLANINVFGQPVPAARFKGGQEFSIATGGTVVPVDAATIRAVLEKQIMLLPSVAPDSGPFQNVDAAWRPDAPVSPAERYCAASLYLALMSDTCLGLISAAGPTILDGPFAANKVYRDALAALTGRDVLWSHDGATGPSVGAALLFHIQRGIAPSATTQFAIAAGLADAPAGALARYRDRWRAEANARFQAADTSSPLVPETSSTGALNDATWAVPLPDNGE